MQSDSIQLGWIGLGKIGTPMAQNLVKAGFSLTVYNRSADKAEPLREAGATVSPDVPALVQQSDIIFTMIANDDAVKDVYDSILQMDEISGKLFIDMSTISKELSIDISKALQKKGASFIDAPVAGSVKPAQEATLIILCGGDDKDIEKAKPYFNKLGKLVKHLGPNGSGIAAKLAINYYLSALYLGLAEAVLLAEQNGIDRQDFLELINESATGSGATKVKTAPLLSGDFKPAFTVAQMLKDVKLAQQEGADFPLATTLEKTYTDAVNDGFGDIDVIGIIQFLQQQKQ